MILKDLTTDAAKNWMSSNTATRSLCHATMYDMKYIRDGDPAKTVLADTVGQNMKNQQ